MRHFASAIMFVVLVFSFAGVTNADTPVDALRAAQVYAPLGLQYACGQFREELVTTGAWTTGDVCFAKFAPSWRVAYLAIGSDVLVDWSDEPLKSIPMSSLGEVRWFSMWLTMYDGAWRAVGSGSAGVPNPAENPLRLVIRPFWVVEEVPFLPPPGGGDPAKLTLVLDDGTAVMYDPIGQRFVFAADPLAVTPYVIYYGGDVVVYGVADPLLKRQRADQVVVNFALEGGVYELPAVQNFRFSSVKLESWFEGLCWDDNPCGSVFFADLKGAAFSVQTSGLGGWIEIRRWTPGGEMPVIAATYWHPANDGTWLSIPEGYGLVVVRFAGWIPAGGEFHFDFWRSGASGGGGGGKG